MASSASSSSAVGSGKSRNSSVSDLLINFRGDFAEWLPAVQKKAIETLEKKCKREVLGAQVNCWQVLAARRLSSINGSRPRFPADVTGVVLAFLGPFPPAERREERVKDTKQRVEAARARDQLRAIEYYQKLVREAAETGTGLFVISQEVFDSAPRSTCGHPIHLAYVAQYFSERLGYRMQFGPDRVPYNDVLVLQAEYNGVESPYPTTSAAYLPLRITLHAKDETSVDAARLSRAVENIWTQLRGSTSTRALGDAQTDIANPNLGSAQSKYVQTANAASAKAAEYVIKIASAHFEAGNTRLLFTEELWNAAPKLPSGKLPLLWPGNGAALEFAGGSRKMSEHLESVWEQVTHSVPDHGMSMGTSSAETSERHQLPVEIVLD